MALIQDIPFFINPLNDRKLDGYLIHYRDRSMLHEVARYRIKSGWVTEKIDKQGNTIRPHKGMLLEGGYYSLHSKTHMHLMNFEEFNDPDFEDNCRKLESFCEKVSRVTSMGGNKVRELQAPPAKPWTATFKLGQGNGTGESGTAAFICTSTEDLHATIDDNLKLPHFRFAMEDTEGQVYGNVDGNDPNYFNFDMLRRIGSIGQDDFKCKVVDIGRVCFWKGHEYGGNAQDQTWTVKYYWKESEYRYGTDLPIPIEPSSCEWDEQTPYSDSNVQQAPCFALRNLSLRNSSFEGPDLLGKMEYLEIWPASWSHPLIDTGDSKIPPDSFFRVLPSPGSYYRIRNLYKIGTGTIAGAKCGLAPPGNTPGDAATWPLSGTNPLGIRQLPKWSTRQLFYKDRQGIIYPMGRDYSDMF